MHALLIFHFFSFLSSYFLLRCGCFFIFRFAPLYLLLISLFFNNRKCHKNLHVQPTQTLKVGGGGSAYHSLKISARNFCKYMKDKAIGCFFIFLFAPLCLLLISLFFNNREYHKNLHVQCTTNTNS